MGDLNTGLEAAGQIIGSASHMLDFFDGIYAKVESIRRKQLSTQNYLRAYYLEVLNNLELLNVIDLSFFKTTAVNSELFRSFICRLETQIGAAILFTEDLDEKSSLFRFLESKGQIKNTRNMIVTFTKGREEPSRDKVLYENILQAISFTVVKIEILKKLSAFRDTEAKLLKNILLEKRIVNIKERFRMIKEIMDDMKGIKELSR